MSWHLTLFDFFTNAILLYSIFVISGYTFIGIYSIGETIKYVQKNSFTNYRLLAGSNETPPITILAPAYNESETIVENVRSLLSIHYNNLELIVINDGSKDESLAKVILAYDLCLVDHFYNEQIPTKKVRGIYRSRNKAYSKLTVVDKENGGKGDALNVGINVAQNDYVVCIDVDCVLEQDAILKLAKAFMEQTDRRIIATGGVIRIANNCEIEDGKLVKVNLPEQFLPRIQTLEYIRSFLLGRMAWSRLNGLLLISGAFGAFDREIVVKAGGYDTSTVGEDMELVVRMRRYMEEQHEPYRVSFIPDPLCWTEAPASFKILGRQRNRWTRGTIETLKLHKVMFFNPKYGLLGMLSYPYWFFFEFMAPLVEFIGFIVFLIFCLLGMVNWVFFFALLGMVLSFGFLYSVFAILMEVLTYNQYNRRKDILKLVVAALMEPFVFHPFVVWSAVKGNIDLIRKKNSWGEMTRQGFAGNKKDASHEINDKPHGFVLESSSLTRSFGAISLAWLALLVISSCIEIYYTSLTHGLNGPVLPIMAWASINDLTFWLRWLIFGFIVYAILFPINRRLANFCLLALTSISVLLQLLLILYFNTALQPLGADLFGYSLADIGQTVGSSSVVNLWGLALLLLFSGITFVVLKWLPRKIRIPFYIAASLPILSLLFIFFSVNDKIKPPAFRNEFMDNLVLNKSDYFFSSSSRYLFPEKNETDIYDGSYLGSLGEKNVDIAKFDYIDETHYPFLHADSTADVLSPFLKQGTTPPNIVIILVEGLGRAFTNKGAYLGNFTPFIDSLSVQSLYWKNFLSQGGRTFAVLPSLLGSLPFEKNGFLELGENMPGQLSLVNLLNFNGYKTSFYYGGDAKFDNMSIYLRKNNIGELNDIKSFPAGYSMLPAVNGFSWGYDDKALFRHYLATREQDTKPQFSVILTIATHDPFIIKEEETYLKRFEQRMDELGFNVQAKNEHRRFKLQYASILYADDALKNFFAAYQKRPDYNNTIFLITGDHRMPEIPMNDKIDRYHVPLILYSPLLMRTAEISSVSTHFDIAPSLLAFLRHSYKLKTPALASWMGSGLDTSREFRNVHAYPLMQTKTDVVDFVMGNYHINQHKLYKILPDLSETPVQDEDKRNQIENSFAQFLKRNELLIKGNDVKLLPDTLLQRYANP